MEKLLLNELKLHFYDWCSYLTIDEIVSNEALIAEIENLERILVAATH